MFRYGSLPLPRRRNYALDCAVPHSHVCSVPSPVPSSRRLLDRPLVGDIGEQECKQTVDVYGYPRWCLRRYDNVTIN